jgi:hypothetical protein
MILYNVLDPFVSFYVLHPYILLRTLFWNTRCLITNYDMKTDKSNEFVTIWHINSLTKHTALL